MKSELLIARRRYKDVERKRRAKIYKLLKDKQKSTVTRFVEELLEAPIVNTVKGPAMKIFKLFTT